MFPLPVVPSSSFKVTKRWKLYPFTVALAQFSRFKVTKRYIKAKPIYHNKEKGHGKDECRGCLAPVIFCAKGATDARFLLIFKIFPIKFAFL